MKQHTTIGANILDHMALAAPDASFLAMAGMVARYHHERFDGRGYPAGLRGAEIPLPARIVAIADAYDAITSLRPYKAPQTARPPGTSSKRIPAATSIPLSSRLSCNASIRWPARTSRISIRPRS